MKKIVLCLTALLLLLLPATNGWAESESPYQTIPFPGKRAKPENFFIAENGALMFKTEDAAYAYQDGQWVKSDMQPASDAFEITREGDAFTVLQDGEPIYTDREMQTLCIMDDAAAYGTKDNKVYQIDISTGKHTAICYVEGWESSDWAQQLLCSGRTLYVIQTLCPRLQKIQIFHKRGGNVLSGKASLGPRIRTIGIVAHIAMEGRAIDIAVMGEQPLNGFIHLAQFFSQHSAAGERRAVFLGKHSLEIKAAAGHDESIERKFACKKSADDFVRREVDVGFRINGELWMILGKQLVFCAVLIGPAQVQIGFATCPF